ncbi:Metallo-beta-lactamase superfamily protein [uncultured archaeon]|nr:Metallo-beta-lactamase superfamily protein [uncultured archaeon]
METMISQPVEGTEGITIYPYIRKIDLMSSNSYILSGPSQIALIDPGGLADQLGILEAEVGRLQDELMRPVVVYLTHVHLDHWIQLKQSGMGRRLQEAFLAVQEEGAKALEKQDSLMTLSGLLGRPMIRVPVDIRLLSAVDKVAAFRQSLALKEWSYDYATKSTEMAQDLVLHSAVVPLGGGDCLEIYHTPRHSPDSICLRAGSLLSVGDLFFAPNPGMAGAYGWSQQDLLASIQKILWILEKEKISFCCSGHGKPIDAQMARKTLQVMYTDAASLKDLEEVSPQWAKRTAAYAQDLIVELERSFTIIAGRLAYMGHILNELEELKDAEELDSLLDSRVLDGLFIDFYNFAMELKAGKKLDWELVHKAGQTVGRLDKLLKGKKLDMVIDQSLLSRVGRVLSDYSVAYRGFRPPYYVSYVDINGLIGEILEQVRHKSYEEEAILEAESQEDYLKALKARIAHNDLFEDVELSFQSDSHAPFVRMDRERFSDILIDILERFAGAKMKKIKIATFLNGDWVLVRISGEALGSTHPLGQASRFFERNLALCGGLLQTTLQADGPSVEIELSALEE